MTVLVVDDNESWRFILLREHLEAEGYRVERGANGAIVSFVADLRPAAVVLDVILPGESGVDIALALRRDPRTGAVPVIFVSGLGEEPLSRYAALGAGAYDVIHKDAGAKAIVKAVNFAVAACLGAEGTSR